MRDYEIVYIFRSSFTPEEIEAKLERFHALLTDDGKGEITAVEQWGKRQLAYPIKKQQNGYYVVAQFTADPETITRLERVLKLEDDLLRYLVVISEGELPIPNSMRAAHEGDGRSRDDDDDDEKKPAAKDDSSDDDDDDDDESDDDDEDDSSDSDDDEEA